MLMVWAWVRGLSDEGPARPLALVANSDAFGGKPHVGGIVVRPLLSFMSLVEKR